MAEREVERWITSHGRRIPIFKGESKADVAKRLKAGVEKGKESRPVTKKEFEKSGKDYSDAKKKAAKAGEKMREASKGSNESPEKRKKFEKARDKAWKAEEKVHEASKKWNKEFKSKKIEKATVNKGDSEREKAISDLMKKNNLSREKAENMYENLQSVKKSREDAKSKPAKSIEGSKEYSQADFDKEFGKGMAKDSGYERPGTKITKIHVPNDEENPYVGVEYSDGKKFVYGLRFDGEVSDKEMRDMIGSSKAKEDETLKSKQIAKAKKAADDLNGKSNTSKKIGNSDYSYEDLRGMSRTQLDKIWKQADKDGDTALKSATTAAVFKKTPEEWEAMKQKTAEQSKAKAEPAKKEEPKTEKKKSKGEDVGHGLRRFQTADGRTLYKDASGHWVKKADAEAKLKGSEKKADKSFNEYDASKDKYCEQLKKDDIIEFEENGKTYKGRIIDGDAEIHKTLPNGAHQVTNAYTVNKLTEDGKDDYSIAGTHKSKVVPKNIKGYKSETEPKKEAKPKKEKKPSTTSTNKSFEQKSAEEKQLQDLPSGSKVEILVDGKWIEHIAHDQAYMGRNGALLRRRTFSVPTDETFRNGMAKLVKDSKTAYTVASGQWRLKKDKK